MGMTVKIELSSAVATIHLFVFNTLLLVLYGLVFVVPGFRMYQLSFTEPTVRIEEENRYANR